MKTNIIFLVFLFGIFSYTASAQCCARHSQASTQAQSQTELVTKSFVVQGNCMGCKAKIEKAASIRGVQNAEWEVATKVLTVTYDPNRTSVEKINIAVQKATNYETSFASTETSTSQNAQGCATKKSDAGCSVTK